MKINIVQKVSKKFSDLEVGDTFCLGPDNHTDLTGIWLVTDISDFSEDSETGVKCVDISDGYHSTFYGDAPVWEVECEVNVREV